MGNQIIRQPTGLFAIFSSHSDTIVVTDATREEILAYFVDLAIQDTTRSVSRLLDQVQSGHPGEAYHQFALTWQEAVARDREHGGHAWATTPNYDSTPGERRDRPAPMPDQP